LSKTEFSFHFAVTFLFVQRPFVDLLENFAAQRPLIFCTPATIAPAAKPERETGVGLESGCAALREEHGLSQRELATRAGLTNGYQSVLIEKKQDIAVCRVAPKSFVGCDPNQ